MGNHQVGHLSPGLGRMIIAVLTCAVMLAEATAKADWPQFRGVNSSGVATGPAPPTEFGPGINQLWKTSLDAGHSSPCIHADKMFLTTIQEESRQLAVVCVDRNNGELLWTRTIPIKEFEKGHPSFNPASSSPACDAERVVAYFGSFGLICFDHDGNKQWDVRMPLAKSFGGNAASPIIADDLVILYRGCYVDHYVLAVEKATGEQRWRVKQEEPFSGEMACTACPIVSGDQLILHTARTLQSLELSSGELRWITKCATTATSTPVLCGDEVIVAAWNKLGEPALRPDFPDYDTLLAENDRNSDDLIDKDEFPELWIFHRPDGAEAPLNGARIRFGRSDNNKDGKLDRGEWNKTLKGIEKFRSGYNTHGILAVPLDSKGIVDADQVRVLETQSIPEVPSPIFHQDQLFIVKNGGVLTCLDVPSGDRLYRSRTRGSGTHYASPLLAGGKIISAAGDGKISVLDSENRCEVLAVNDMQEPVYATPAIVEGILYVRTHHSLYAFGVR